MELERLQVVIEASTAGFKDKVKKVKEITEEATKKVVEDTKKIRESLDETTKGKVDKSNLDLYIAKIKETEETLADLKDKQEKSMSATVRSNNIDKLRSKILDLKDKLADVYAQMDQIQGERFEGISEMPYADDASMEKALKDALAKDKAYQKLIGTVNKLNAELEANKVALAETVNLQKQSKAEEFEKQKIAIAEAETELVKLNAALDENVKKQSSVGSKLSIFWDRLRNSLKRVDTANESVRKSTKNVNAGLRGMGIGLKNSLLMTNPLSKSVFKLSNMFKLMALRMVMRKAFNAILEGFKDLSKVNAGFNNTMSSLQSGFLQARNALSTAFAPALKALAPLISTITNAFINAMNVLGMFTSRLFGNASTFIKAKQVTTDYAKSLGGTADAAKEAKGELAGFDEINTIGSKDDPSNTDTGMPKPEDMFEELEIPADKLSFIDTIKSKIDELMIPLKNIDFSNVTGAFERLKEAVAPITSSLFSGLEWAYLNIFVPFSGWVVEDVAPKFLDALSSAMDVLNSVLDVLKPLGIWLWDSFLEPLGKWTGNAVLKALDWLNEKLRKFSDWIKDNQELVQDIVLVVGAFAVAWGLVNLAVGLWNIIGPIATGVTAAFGGAMKFLTSPIGLTTLAIGAVIAIVVLLIKHWDDVKAVAGKCWDWIKEKWGQAGEWINNTVVVPISKFFSGLWTGVQNGASNAWNGITKVFTKASYWFTSKVINPIKNGFKSFVNGLISFVEGFVNGFVSGINIIIRAANKLHFKAPDWLGGKEFGIKIPEVKSMSIPRLAQGAVIPPNGEFLAVLGDQKHGKNLEGPEVLFRQIIREEINNLGSNSNSSQEVTINFGGNMSQLIRVLKPYIDKENSRVGSKLVIGGA